MLRFSSVASFKKEAVKLLKASAYESHSALNVSEIGDFKRHLIIDSNSAFICVKSTEHDSLAYYDNDIGLPSFLSLKWSAKKLDYYIDEVMYTYKYKLHRPFAPATLRFNDDGLYFEEYFINGQLHNSVGPARRQKVNSEWACAYYLNGRCVAANEFFRNRRDII